MTVVWLTMVAVLEIVIIRMVQVFALVLLVITSILQIGARAMVRSTVDFLMTLNLLEKKFE